MHETTHALEIELLAALATELPERTAVDVGAERGDLTAALLDAGFGPLHAIEPFAGNVDALRERFADDPRVVVHGLALGDEVGSTRLLLAHDAGSGAGLDYYHTIVDPPGTADVAWEAGPEVEVATLADLVERDVLPARVGLVKVDAEGADLAILSKLGQLDPDLVMLEHWTDLPDTLGPCPWTVDDARAVLGEHGLHAFGFVCHRHLFEWVQWGSARCAVGDWGNLVFLHDRVAERLGPVVVDHAARSANEMADRGRMFAAAAEERAAAAEEHVDKLEQANERIETLESWVNHLRQPGPVPRTMTRFGRTRLRARETVQGSLGPRLGRLIQHPPRELTVPRHYGRTRIAADAAPSIALVTPSFEQAAFVEQTIRSVLGQRYPALRYVVQDGGSADGTLDVLRHLESPAWSWRSAPDDGQADAINRGFAGTESDLMGWLNADDLLLPGALAAAAAHLRDHPEIDVVYAQRVLIDSANRRVGLWITPPHDPEALRLADYVPQETLLWRRSLWERVGGLNASLHYALDWDLLLRFADAGARFARLPRFTGAFRIHDAQKTTSRDDVGDREVAMLRERVHGRPLERDELVRHLRPYLRRSVGHHIPHRLADQLPLPRMAVDPWLMQALS